MRRILIAVALLLSGCGWVDDYEIQAATIACAPHGGVLRVFTNQVVLCTNGMRVDFSGYVRKKRHAR